MRGENYHLVIEWDLTEDQDFSLSHKVLIGAIYAVHHSPGWLEDVWEWGKTVVTGIWETGTEFVTKALSHPLVKAGLAVVGTLASGGALGPALLAGGLTAFGLPGEQMIAQAGGTFAMVKKYMEPLGGLVPEGVWDTVNRVAGTITSVVGDPLMDLYERYKPMVKGWLDYFAPVTERITKVLGWFQGMLPEEVQASGLGIAWGDRRVSGEIMSDILKTPPEFGLMTDPHFTDYLREVHELGRVTPPVPPVSMPQIKLDHLGPPTGQLWQTVTGIGKIIPAMEGVWNAIKDIWSIIKDSLIFISNWLKVTFQETLNLMVTAIGDISRFLPTAVNSLTVQIWQSVREFVQALQGMIASFGTQLFEWGTYATNFLRDQVAQLWKFLSGLPQYFVEVLQALINPLYGAVNELRSWASKSASDLWAFLSQQTKWLLEVIRSFFTSFLPSLLSWFWEQLKALASWATEVAVPTVARGVKGAWVQVEEHFKGLTYQAYSASETHLRRYVPMTPERAPEAGAGLLGIAIGFGIGAHTLSTVTELAHPLKTMGVHYLAGFMAQMGNFGTIASSTMGILVAYSLRRPMGYYVSRLFRPTQPAAMDLMMMAVKPDISVETFRRGMSYEGYSEEWINAFQRTMYHEPRYFELSMMGEDESATTEWLFTKARRAGYTHEDSIIFTKSLIKKATRTQRQDLYKQAFNSFKEGFVSKAQFTGYLDALELRPEAKYFAVVGAELAYRFDYINDMIRLYTDSYLADLMDEDDFGIAIASLGIEERKASLIFNRARIRKLPKVLREEKKEAQAAIREVQKKYQDLYRTLYRDGRITEDQYRGYLEALGMTPQMAEITVSLEVARTYEPPEEVEAREQEKLAKKIQGEQVRKYKAQYRRGLISFESLIGYLMLSGIDVDLAIAIAETERATLKPEAVPVEVITS